MNGYIYLVENQINKKKYIGKTYNSIEQRWNEHIRDSKKLHNNQRPLYKAFNKYGIENFTISQIDYCENCEEREKYWIDFYDSYKNGYNATLGGDGKTYFEHSDEEVINQYKEFGTIKLVAEFFGCDHKTIQTRLKNNNIDTTKNRAIPSVIIEQYTIDKEYIQTFESISDAVKWIVNNNISTAKHSSIFPAIATASKNFDKKISYGFRWKRHSL